MAFIRLILERGSFVIEHWRRHYNKNRPHSALGYRPPAPEVVIPKEMNTEMETGQMAAYTKLITGPVGAVTSIQ
jgi:hypothetical protein